MMWQHTWTVQSATRRVCIGKKIEEKHISCKSRRKDSTSHTGKGTARKGYKENRKAIARSLAEDGNRESRYP